MRSGWLDDGVLVTEKMRTEFNHAATSARRPPSRQHDVRVLCRNDVERGTRMGRRGCKKGDQEIKGLEPTKKLNKVPVMVRQPD